MKKEKEKRATFTPGPWVTSRSTHGTWIESAKVKATWSLKEGRHEGRWAGHVVSLPDHMEQDGIQCGSIAGQDKTQGEIEANARLIAAAPEMYEVLLEVLLEYKAEAKAEGWDLPVTGEKLRAILAKIDGGEG